MQEEKVMKMDDDRFDGGLTMERVERMEKSAAGALFACICIKLRDLQSLVDRRAEYEKTLEEMDDFLQSLLQFSRTVGSPFPHVELCKWLISSGEDPEAYCHRLRQLDSSVTCGLVWMPSFIAYRCKTCSQNPAMSLCRECFLDGNHEGHDFNMFRSQTGGACDCGDASVMKPQGFCSRHGAKALSSRKTVPDELMLPAQRLVPQILCRLVTLFRELTFRMKEFTAWDDGGLAGFLDILDWLSTCGCAMRSVMTKFLLDEVEYQKYLTFVKLLPGETPGLLAKFYNEAVSSLTPVYAYHELEVYDCLDLYSPLCHVNMLQEIVFWTIKFEFPQRMVNFLLSLLTEPDFKMVFARSYAEHYGHLARVLGKQQNTDAVSNRVVHISVQLFSSEPIVLALVNNHSLLRRVVFSLHSMIRYCLVGSGIQGADARLYQVVDCRSLIISNHNYWAVVLDLHNLLSSATVAAMFLRDPVVLDIWMRMTMSFQGMDMNIRELKKHVEFESRTYSTAFTAELELFSMTTWSLVQHLNNQTAFDCILLVLQNAVYQLKEWFKCVQYSRYAWWRLHNLELCFHYPLHRTCAAFMRCGYSLGMKLLVPAESFLRALVMHPLQLQVGRCEVAANMWVFNGTSMRYQSYLYAQSHYCYSFVDLDIYLLQFSMRKCNSDWFVLSIFDRFHLAPWFSFPPEQKPIPYLRTEWLMPMMEGALRLLATLFTFTSNLGCSEREALRCELAELIAVADRTYSQLIEHLPERTGHMIGSIDPETVIREVADYQEPKFNTDGRMSPGVYVPKDTLWENDYDPLFVLHRSFSSADFQQSMDRYRAYAKSKYNLTAVQAANLWPPLKMPGEVLPVYESMRRVLQSRSLHAVIYVILYKAIRENVTISDVVTYLCVYLLELAIRLPYKSVKTRITSDVDRKTVIDLQLGGWFSEDCVLANMAQRIDHVLYSSDFKSVVDCVGSTDVTFLDLLWLSERLETSITVIERQKPDETQGLLGKEIPFIDSTYQAAPESPGDHLRNKLINTLASGIREQYFPNVPRYRRSSGDWLNPVSSEGAADTSASLDDQVRISPCPAADSRLSSDEMADVSSEEIVDVITPDDVYSAGVSTFPASGMEETFNTDGGQQESDSLGEDSEKECSAGSTRLSPVPHSAEMEVSFRDLGGESLLSLLIALHDNMAKQNATNASYVPSQTAPPDDSKDCRVGDGPFFVRNVLDRAYHLSDSCRAEIDRVCAQHSAKMAALSKEEEESGGISAARKKAARDYQQRLMAQFKAHQADLSMEFEKCDATLEQDTVEQEKAIRYEYQISGVEVFECCVCSVRSAGTPKNPMCLLIHAQSTNVLAQQSLNADSDEQFASNLRTRGALENDLQKLLCCYFNELSCLAVRGSVVRGSVYVQSCGHFIHRDCHTTYLNSLKSDQMQLNSSSWNFKRGEMSCPGCRRICNAVMPVVPVFAYFQDPKMTTNMAEMAKLFQANTFKVLPMYGHVCGEFVAHLWCATYPQFSQDIHKRGVIQSFVANTARSTWELNVLTENVRSERSLQCNELFLRTISLLFCELEFVNVEQYMWQWTQLTGCQSLVSLNALESGMQSVPVLLHNSHCLLVRFCLLLRHLCLNEDVFSALCRAIWNLVVAQFCLDEVVKLAPDTVRQLAFITAEEVDCNSLPSIVTYAVSCLRQLPSNKLLAEDSEGSMGNGALDVWDGLSERFHQKTLPFLRLVAFIKSAVIPTAKLPSAGAFCDHKLMIRHCLGNDQLKNDYWQTDVKIEHFKQMIFELVGGTLSDGQRKLVELSAPRLLHAPKLMDLPIMYDTVFQKYHNHECQTCKRIPREALLCLVCGDFLCFRDHCCRKNNITEAEQHAIDCCAGTGVFLAVNTSFIVITREKRCSEWGSVYLDSHGEEDRGLGRGKPLKLSPERFDLLQRQWLSHSFDFVCRRWNWITRNPNVYSVIS